MHFAADGSRFTYKGNNDYRVDFRSLFDVCFVVSCALLPRRFQKPSVFSIWRRSDRYGARTARAFVSRETIVSVTLNMLISL